MDGTPLAFLVTASGHQRPTPIGRGWPDFFRIFPRFSTSFRIFGNIFCGKAAILLRIAYGGLGAETRKNPHKPADVRKNIFPKKAAGLLTFSQVFPQFWNIFVRGVQSEPKGRMGQKGPRIRRREDEKDGKLRAVDDHDLEGVVLGMGGEFDGVGSFFEGELVGDELADIELAGEYEFGDVLLQGVVGGIAAEHVLLVHADAGEVGGCLGPASCVGKEHDLARAADELASLLDGGVRWDGDDGGVESAIVGEAFDFRVRSAELGLGSGDGLPPLPDPLPRCRQRGRRGSVRLITLAATGIWPGTRIEGPAGAPFASEFEARIHEVGGEDLHAPERQDAGEHEADGPLPRHEHGVATQEGKLGDGLEDGIDGFLHGAFEEGVLARDFDDAGQDKGHDANIFRVATAGGFEARRDAGEVFVLRTLGEGVMAAGMAIHARHVMVEADAFTDGEAANARADLDDGAGGFVAENAGRRDGAIVDLLDVGGANAAGRDLHEQFTGTDARDRERFEAQIVHAAVNDGPHGFGYKFQVQLPMIHYSKAKIQGQTGPSRVWNCNFVAFWRHNGGMRREYLIYLLLGLVTLAVYWPVMRAEFINYDDAHYIVENANIQSGVTGKAVEWAFTTGYASNWHPVTWISHMIDCRLYGLNAGRHHLTNLLFHIANTLLLFGLLRLMTGAVWRSAIVAALFAWHPTHVESVAWVAERKDVLSTFFLMLTLLAYVRYAKGFKDQGSRFKLYYGLALFFFALGLMSKPMLVTLPFVMLLLDFWPLRRIYDLRSTIYEPKDAPRPQDSLPLKKLIWEKIPFFVLAVASSVVTFEVQKAGGAMRAMSHLSGDAQIANALVAYVRYLGKVFWPVDLAVFYPYRESMADWQVLGALLVLIAVTVWVFRSWRRRPYLLVGWLWFVGTLVPVIGLVQVGEASMADRYLYIPALGIFIAAVWGVADLASGWGAAVRNGVGGAMSVLTLASCIALTVIQIGYWHDSVTLFQHVLDVTPKDNRVGEYNMDVAEYNLGQGLAIRGKVIDATAHFERAIQFNPNDYKAHNNLGLCLATQGKYVEATNHYATALLLDPDNADAHFNFGLALEALGDVRGAIAQEAESARLDPDQPDTHYDLGLFLAQAGRLEDAKKELLEALRLKPNYPEAHAKLGMAFGQLGEPGSAIKQYEQALQLNPNLIEPLNNLAWIHAANSEAEFRNGAEAVRLAQRACELTGNAQPALLGTLAAAYAEAGQFKDAVEAGTKARDLATSHGLKQIAANNEELLKLYRANQPFHEAPRKLKDDSAGK